MSDNYSGIQKAAILLITLGPEKASSIFQHLKEDEIESLTLEIANTRSVSPSDKDEVLEEFYQVCLAQQYIAEGGFAPEEIALVDEHATMHRISLGRRILRTETAGLATLAMLVYNLDV